MRMEKRRRIEEKRWRMENGDEVKEDERSGLGLGPELVIYRLSSHWRIQVAGS